MIGKTDNLWKEVIRLFSVQIGKLQTDSCRFILRVL